jgi:hypothetical protein
MKQTAAIPMKSKTHYGLKNEGRRQSKIRPVKAFRIKWFTWQDIGGRLVPIEGPFFEEPGTELIRSDGTKYIVTDHGNVIKG